MSHSEYGFQRLKRRICRFAYYSAYLCLSKYIAVTLVQPLSVDGHIINKGLAVQQPDASVLVKTADSLKEQVSGIEAQVLWH